MKGNKKKRHKQAKRVKEPDKPSNMVTKVDKALSTETADQNYYEKIYEVVQVDEMELMNSPLATVVEMKQLKTSKKISEMKKDQNFFEKPKMVSNETNMDNNNDLQDMEKMMEDSFQLSFKKNWETCIKEQKLKHPTWSVSSTETSMVLYVKGMEEHTKCLTYVEMCQ